NAIGNTVTAHDQDHLVLAIHDPIQQEIYDVIGPTGTGPHLLAAHDGSTNTATKADVIVNVDSDYSFHVDMRLHQSLVNSSTNFDLGLGLPGVPFRVTANGGVTVQVGFDYELAFNYNNSDSSFSADTSKTLQGNGPGAGHEMSLNVTASLPSSPQFNATLLLGLLEGKITDHNGNTS